MPAMISCIVPVYNVEPYLEKCVASVLAQTWTDFELLLVDDGSKDASGAICDALAAKDARILVIHQRNMGLGMARNSGLDAASGKYVFFIDSDDYIEANLFMDAVSAAEESQAELVQFGYVRELMPAPKRQVSSAQIVQRVVYPKGEMTRAEFLHRLRELYIPSEMVWQRMYLRSWMQRHNLRFTAIRRHEDTVFTSTMLGCPFERIVFLPDAYYHYIVARAGSIMSCFDPRNMDDRFDSLDYLLSLAEGMDETERGDALYFVYQAFVTHLSEAIKKSASSPDTIPLRQRLNDAKRWSRRPDMQAALRHVHPRFGTRAWLLSRGGVSLAVLIQGAVARSGGKLKAFQGRREK